MAVWVLGRPEKPLMPCPQKCTQRLLERAMVHPMVPFTICLKDRRVEDSGLWSLRVRLAPGSKNDGHGARARRGNRGWRGRRSLAVSDRNVVSATKHRGRAIREALRRRAADVPGDGRCDHRTRPEGWLAPSFPQRVDAIIDRGTKSVLSIKMIGEGNHPRTRLIRYGVPRGQLMPPKAVQGVETGDIVKVLVSLNERKWARIGAP